ncbi:MAG: carbonic anhydrase [Proteobacteria bacterium]|nr:carbonic anhydrase [Pseudomonadota bacterium]
MSQIRNEVLEANAAYVSNFGSKGDLTIPPARQFAVLTCMDARLDPAKFAGLAEGDAHVIRNAGGRASDDAIRSLVISYKLLGTREWFVIHHTNCGMATFTDEIMGDLLESSLETAALGESGWSDDHDHEGSAEGKSIDWLAFTDAANAVTEDVRTIRNHPLVPAAIPIYGFVYNVSTGALEEVAEATEAGQAG